MVNATCIKYEICLIASSLLKRNARRDFHEESSPRPVVLLHKIQKTPLCFYRSSHIFQLSELKKLYAYTIFIQIITVNEQYEVTNQIAISTYCHVIVRISVVLISSIQSNYPFIHFCRPQLQFYCVFGSAYEKWHSEKKISGSVVKSSRIFSDNSLNSRAGFYLAVNSFR